MNEIYKNLGFLGYPNYEVSNLGNVKSLNYNRSGREKLLKLQKDKDGYLKILFHKDGKTKSFQVHRLVAMAFLTNPYNLPMINHRNEIKTDNRVENLEWCDKKYNNNYGTGNKRRAEKLSIPVRQYSINGKFIKEYPSALEAEKQTGFDHSNIAKCINGKYKHTGGFIWKYQS